MNICAAAFYVRAIGIYSRGQHPEIEFPLPPSHSGHITPADVLGFFYEDNDFGN
jgi:hypothetical protein